ncbi:MAG: acyltransferase domain-containing protein, partial [Thermoplasmata archaeon]|nr:acyltransferase domain-containing protein [Thermoplasmata archaeon]
TDRKEAYKAIRSEMNNRGGAGFTDDRGTSPFLLMGTDGLMAREFEKAGNLGSIVSSMFGQKERSENKVHRKDGIQMSEGETTVDGGPVTSDYYDRSIAIVGIGTVFPKGIGLDNYWNMIMKGVDACDEIPIDRFDWRLHYDPDPTVKDRMYTKLGAFVRELDFNSFDYKIPPKVAEQIDHYQRFELVASKEALTDAGLYQNKDLDRERVGVIIANSGGGENRDWCAIRVGIEEIQQYATETETWKGLPEDAREALFSQIRDKIDDNIIPINEDTMPGSLPNIASGRVANVFGFSGPNFITDAACASTLAAISTARDNLILGRMDICVSGGTDSSMTTQGFIEFCKIGALTPDGSRPFSKGANGFLMGEGSGILILKRLDDAVRDGDRIYAIIKGVGGSSDGKGKGITAPNPRGQTLAVNRAVEDAGVDLSTISFVEAHGTSTSVGDVAELVGLMGTFKGLPPKSIGLTSVKSQIGHLKAAAGAAGLIKAVMAIKNKILPPQINFTGPNPYFEWEKSPFYVITESGRWDRISPDVPRRCGVSAFGFGGTNFHIVLEEFDESIYLAYQKAKELKPTAPISFEEEDVKIEREVDERSIAQYLEKRGNLESEVFMFSSDNPLDLLSQADKAALRIEEVVSKGGRVRDALVKPSYEGRYRLSIVAGSKEELTGKIEALKKAGMNEKALLVLRAKGIFIGDRTRIDLGKVCFMFPGQGSQYLNMFRDLHDKYSIVRDVFSEADGVMKDLIPKSLSSFVFTDEVRGTDAFKEAQETLRQTEFNQPSMLTADTSMYKMLLALGVSPDLVVGHSLGEYGALIASGVLTFEGALQAVSARGKEMRDLKVDDPGKMASVSAGLDKVE